MSKKVLVIGDTILDHYIHGEVSRISPEAPVPVFDKKSTETVLGGACNVAANIRTLTKDENLQIDYFGFFLPAVLKLFQEYKIQHWGVPVSSDEILTKTRYICQNQQMFRVDNNKNYLNVKAKEVLYLSFKSLDFSKYDMIVVSDYDKGTLREDEFEILSELNIPTIIDLKRIRLNMPSFKKNPHIILKCNEKEYEENPHMDLIAAKDENPTLVVTLGKNGFWFPQINQKYPRIQTHPVRDVTGAGDSFTAGMAAKYLNDDWCDIYGWAKYGNLAAAVKVQNFGTKAVTWKEVNNINATTQRPM